MTANPRYLKPPTCEPCSLSRIGFGFAPPVGPANARLRFYGEALGFEEAIAGEAFYGAAGGVLSRICMRAGIDRRYVRIHNIVNCRPPQDYLAGAPWEQHAIACCRQYVDPELALIPDGGVVVALGGVALDALLNLSGVPGVAVKDFHGTVHEVVRADGSKYYIVPSFHPSHLQRGAMNLLEVVTDDFRKAFAISQHGFTRSPCQLVVDPPVEWFRNWCVDHVSRIDRDPDGVHLSLDSEFPEKAPGMDEGEVVEWNAQSPLTRINGANQRDLGWTVPYVGDYIPVFDWFLYECAKRHAWAWFWNKYADLDHFRAHGHRFEGLNAVDGMWLWHHIQTDVMRGLGFVAPMASDFGAWKHWGKVKEKEGLYGAADGVQNWRTCMWVLQGAVDLGQWDMFVRDWHERDMYCLRPAHELGVPVDRPALEQFHADLQGKLGHILDRLKQTAADGVLKPKLGYAKRPKGPLCAACGGAGVPPGVCGYCGGPANVGVCQNYGCEGHRDIEFVCAACEGTGHEAPTPPASIIGKSKSKKAGPSGIGGEAKLQYMTEGVRLVEKIVVAEVRECRTCGKQNVGTKHRCPLPRRRRKAEGDGSVASPAPVERIAQLVLVPREQVRYFWQLPFNPDAPAQILAYLDKQGIDAPLDKKTQRKTTNKKALEGLKAQHKDDPFFSLQMDWKAVQKVDATYAVGTLKLLDADDRVHPEYLPVPATLRDSARHPNLTNVVADKSGVQGLAAGFRRCIVARDGLPRGVTAEEYAAWEARWT